MRSIESRLVRLERVRADPFTDVLSWIAAHRLYSDLTEAERERYAQYQGVNRQAIEDCLLAAWAAWTILFRNEPPNLHNRNLIQSLIYSKSKYYKTKGMINHVRVLW